MNMILKTPGSRSLLPLSRFLMLCAVAAAVLDWGMDNGATNFSHVFQPLGTVGVRQGLTGQLHNQLFTFGDDGKPDYKFKSTELLRGETDGSSYPNGGLRSKLILLLPALSSCYVPECQQ